MTEIVDEDEDIDNGIIVVITSLLHKHFNKIIPVSFYSDADRETQPASSCRASTARSLPGFHAHMR